MLLLLSNKAKEIDLRYFWLWRLGLDLSALEMR